MIKIIATQNEEWGFWGTCVANGQTDVATDWKNAFEFIANLKPVVKGKPVTGDEIRVFLDSTMGRHLADVYCGQSNQMARVHAQWPVTSKAFNFDEIVAAFRRQPW